MFPPRALELLRVRDSLKWPRRYNWILQFHVTQKQRLLEAPAEKTKNSWITLVCQKIPYTAIRIKNTYKNDDNSDFYWYSRIYKALLYILSQFTQELCPVTLIVMFILKMNKLGLRESNPSDLPPVPELVRGRVRTKIWVFDS